MGLRVVSSLGVCSVEFFPETERLEIVVDCVSDGPGRHGPRRYVYRCAYCGDAICMTSVYDTGDGIMTPASFFASALILLLGAVPLLWLAMWANAHDARGCALLVLAATALWVTFGLLFALCAGRFCCRDVYVCRHCGTWRRSEYFDRS